MKIFDFPIHTVSHSYPQRGTQVQLGGNWTFSTAPRAPVMRTFTLRFDMLRWIKNNAGLYTSSIDPEINALRLDEFYREHELHKDFIYPHEIYGNLVVKFAQPLVLPEAKKDGFGAILNVSLTLIEQPT